MQIFRWMVQDHSFKCIPVSLSCLSFLQPYSFLHPIFYPSAPAQKLASTHVIYPHRHQPMGAIWNSNPIVKMARQGWGQTAKSTEYDDLKWTFFELKGEDSPQVHIDSSIPLFPNNLMHAKKSFLSNDITFGAHSLVHWPQESKPTFCLIHLAPHTFISATTWYDPHHKIEKVVDQEWLQDRLKTDLYDNFVREISLWFFYNSLNLSERFPWRSPSTYQSILP